MVEGDKLWRAWGQWYWFRAVPAAWTTVSSSLDWWMGRGQGELSRQKDWLSTRNNTTTDPHISVRRPPRGCFLYPFPCLHITTVGFAFLISIRSFRSPLLGRPELIRAFPVVEAESLGSLCSPALVAVTPPVSFYPSQRKSFPLII